MPPVNTLRQLDAPTPAYEVMVGGVGLAGTVTLEGAAQDRAGAWAGGSWTCTAQDGTVTAGLGTMDEAVTVLHRQLIEAARPATPTADADRLTAALRVVEAVRTGTKDDRLAELAAFDATLAEHERIKAEGAVSIREGAARGKG